LEQRPLHLRQRLGHLRGKIIQSHRRLAARAPCHRDLPRRDVARTDLEPQRHPPRLPLEVLGARLRLRTRVELEPNAGFLQVYPLGVFTPVNTGIATPSAWNRP